MDIGTRLRRRWYLVLLAAIVAIAVAGAELVTFVHGSPHEKRKIYHVATGELLVDTNPSTLTNITANSGALGSRAELISEYGTGPSVVARIAADAGVPVSQLQVQAETTSATKSGSASSKGIVVGSGPDSVLMRATSQGQTIDISAQAHKGAEAKRLVNATITALTGSLRSLQNSQALNHITTSSTTNTTTTSTTRSGGAAKNGKGGKGTGAGKRSSSSNSSAAAQSAAQAAAARQARSVALTKIVLRKLGAVSVSKVIVTPSKTKAVGYAVGAFIILLVLILALDNVLQGSPQRARVATPAPTGPED